MDLLGSVMLMTYSSKAATTTARYKLYVHYYRGFFGTSYSVSAATRQLMCSKHLTKI